ncbi:MAG: DegV family protein, partial [Bacilli bacterium]
RVSAVVAKIASLLNIKVLLKGSDEAKIVSFGKVHGRAMSIKTLAKTCLDHIVDKDQTIYICHCDAKDDANKLKDLVVAGGCKNVELYYYDLITGAHVGPGTLAIFYMGENRNN